jgi:hypothetical protein
VKEEEQVIAGSLLKEFMSEYERMTENYSMELLKKKSEKSKRGFFKAEVEVPKII